MVIIPFPYSDLSDSKRRSALVLAKAGRGDFLSCQITSKEYGDLYALSLKESDFLSGGIKRDSFIHGAKLFIANKALILGVAEHLTHSKFQKLFSNLMKCCPLA